MGMLQRFESRLEQAVSGAFAKAFRSAVQPVELAAALQREVDNAAQILSRDRRLVPNTFAIELSPLDSERLGPYSDTLGRELTAMLHEYAGQQHYVFAGPVSIDFQQEDDLGTGRFRVRSRAAAHVEAAPRRATAAPAEPSSPGASGRARTEVLVEVNGTRHPVLDRLVVGRGTEADLRINDPGVSRRHAELRLESGDLVVEDLGSTNGTLVDGERVERRRLHDGATVRVGHTDLVVRLGTV
jgi:Protein of unknown function (DUF3662)/FHA domain